MGHASEVEASWSRGPRRDAHTMRRTSTSQGRHGIRAQKNEAAAAAALCGGTAAACVWLSARAPGEVRGSPLAESDHAERVRPRRVERHHHGRQRHRRHTGARSNRTGGGHGPRGGGRHSGGGGDGLLDELEGPGGEAWHEPERDGPRVVRARRVLTQKREREGRERERERVRVYDGRVGGKVLPCLSRNHE